METLDPAIHQDIRSRLEALVAAEDIAIPLAVESGSRAWGFPSPDSDFDCRFIFVRSRDAYLSLAPPRDVIELPLTPVFDINGWDLAKALKLLLKGNAVIVEWLTSPLLYRRDAEFHPAAIALADAIADRHGIMTHYHHLARQQLDWVRRKPDTFPLKKLFYGLRPLIALRWLDAHPNLAVAPMHFPTLCQETALPADLLHEIDALMARKAATRELGEGPVPPAILSFLIAELDRPEPSGSTSRIAGSERLERANAFFRRWVERFSTG